MGPKVWPGFWRWTHSVPSLGHWWPMPWHLAASGPEGSVDLRPAGHPCQWTAAGGGCCYLWNNSMEYNICMQRTPLFTTSREWPGLIWPGLGFSLSFISLNKLLEKIPDGGLKLDGSPMSNHYNASNANSSALWSGWYWDLEGGKFKQVQ